MPAWCRCRSPTAIAATAGTATWCWCARGRCATCARSACPGSSRAARWSPTSTSPSGRCGWWRRTSGSSGTRGCCRSRRCSPMPARSPDRPVVMMGDLNEWRRQRRSALKRFAPGFGPLGHGVPSFPSYFPVLALDRVMAQPHEHRREIAAHDTPLARLASDHLPVRAVIRLDGAAAATRRGAARTAAAAPAAVAAADRSRAAAAMSAPLAAVAASWLALAGRPMRSPSARPTRTATVLSPSRRRCGSFRC